MDAVVRSSFDDALRFLEDRAIEVGASVSPNHLIHGLKVAEKLRAVVVGNREKPKQGV
jgi:hypothetical protein